MKDKFSVFQVNGFWGIIEDNSDWKQSSVKSYIGPNLIVKRLNEQADQINQLKQQLEESFTEEDVEGLIEDRDKTIKFLQKQLAEKDKEIECLNKRIDRYENMFRSRINRTRDMQKDIELYINQLAITELEKVKILTEWKFNSIADVVDYIDQQIKELKGEKDVKD